MGGDGSPAFAALRTVRDSVAKEGQPPMPSDSLYKPQPLGGCRPAPVSLNLLAHNQAVFAQVLICPLKVLNAILARP